MPTLQEHSYNYSLSRPEGLWTWRTSLDISGNGPAYSIYGIVSPYGILRDSIPIPGDVINAMADSLSQIQQQFAPGFLVSPASLSFTVDEGRGSSPEQSITVTNNGAFGSLLDSSVTASAAYLHLNTLWLHGIGYGNSGAVGVFVDASQLVAVSSPYAATITFQDPAATNSPQVVPVAVVVRPKAEIDTSLTTLTFTVVKPITGPFPVIADQTFDVLNVGPIGSVLEFQVTRLLCTSAWLASFIPGTGVLGSGDSETVVVTVAPPEGMCVGSYTETLRVSGYSSNGYVDVQVILNIT